MNRFPLLLMALIVLSLTSAGVAASPTGTWRGSWLSETTGHTGPLKARIRQTGDDTYKAVFVGRFAKVIPFVYPAKLERVPGTCHCYSSSQRLPLMGTYRMTASVTGNRFQATFTSRKDRGTFKMSR